MQAEEHRWSINSNEKILLLHNQFASIKGRVQSPVWINIKQITFPGNPDSAIYYKRINELLSYEIQYFLEHKEHYRINNRKSVEV